MTRLEERVESILDAPPLEGGRPAELAEIDALRSAALAVIEDEEASGSDRARVLRALFRAARTAVLPEWAIDAIRAELAWSRESAPRPVITGEVPAARRLRQRGFACCPTCLRDLLSEIECRDREIDDELWLARNFAHARAVGRAR